MGSGRSQGGSAPRPLSRTQGSLAVAVFLIAAATVGILWWRSAGPFKPPLVKTEPAIAEWAAPLGQYRFTSLRLDWVSGDKVPLSEEARFYQQHYVAAPPPGKWHITESLANGAKVRIRLKSNQDYFPNAEQTAFLGAMQPRMLAEMRRGGAVFQPTITEVSGDPKGEFSITQKSARPDPSAYAGPLTVTIHTRDTGAAEVEFWVSWHGDACFRHPADRRYWLLVPVYKGRTFVYGCSKADLQPALEYTLSRVAGQIASEYLSVNPPPGHSQVRILPPDD